MYLVIDRFEKTEDGTYTAVCEKDDGSFINIPGEDLPAGAGESSVLRLENGAMILDRDEEQRRRREAIRLQNSLWGD